MLASTFSAAYGRMTEGEVYAVSDADAQHLVDQGLAEATKDKPTSAESEQQSSAESSGGAITRDKAKAPQADKP
jgi:hypothetical protein